ncbi:MAG: hypothetical protein KME27_31110 [Lyngbya sp. HA4199-MV5]|jgi:uncharacterized protein YaeQ|nr:hypothetical protein [Lyngbya sp. HA4199-MV5]
MKLALQWFTQSKQPATGDRTQLSLMGWVEQASQFLVERLMTDAEPRVWYTSDADGCLLWHAYDPVTGRSFTDVSEAEMRAWIEQRYTAAC